MKREDHSLPQAPAATVAHIDVSDRYINFVANAALAEIDGRSDAYSRQKILRIVQAQKEVSSLLICIVTVVSCIALEAGTSQTGIFICPLNPVGLLLLIFCLVLCETLLAHRDIKVASIHFPFLNPI